MKTQDGVANDPTTEEERKRWTQGKGDWGGAEWRDRTFRLVRDYNALHAALESAEYAMDWINGDTGTKSRPCSFCHATEYNAEVGIEHTKECPLLGARAVIARGKELTGI